MKKKLTFISAKLFSYKLMVLLELKTFYTLEWFIYINKRLEKKDIVSEVCFKYLENFNYYEYLNSISFHPPVMIITTLVFFYIRRKILLKGEKH